MGLFKKAAGYGLFLRYLDRRRSRRAYRGGGAYRRRAGRRGLLRRLLG